MRFEYGLITIVGLLASISLILIAEQYDAIPYWNYLHKMKQQEFEDDIVHTFGSDDKNNPWITGTMMPGESTSVIFNNTGIFSYHGMPGPWATGKVIVLEE